MHVLKSQITGKGEFWASVLSKTITNNYYLVLRIWHKQVTNIKNRNINEEAAKITHQDRVKENHQWEGATNHKSKQCVNITVST